MILKYLNPKNYIDHLKYLQDRRFRRSYAQVGEDLIIQHALNELKIKNPTYLDIGANDPTYLNNTYLFYGKGKGVCVEPNPQLADLIRQKRPKDLVINAGIGATEEFAPYYMMTSHALNTFSKEDADETVLNTALDRTPQKIKETRMMWLLNINNVIEDNFVPDILSLDAEGFDLKILTALTSKPRIICVETLRYEDGKLQKSKQIKDLLLSRGYEVYGDTRVNTIFIS